MIEALLVDDEELARQRLRKLLAAFTDVNVIAEAEDGEEAMQKIAERRPGVVFLDIEMPGAGGLEIVRSLGSPRPRIVFCTGYDQYAVEAFELHAVDICSNLLPANAWNAPSTASASRRIRSGSPRSIA